MRKDGSFFLVFVIIKTVIFFKGTKKRFAMVKRNYHGRHQEINPHPDAKSRTGEMEVIYENCVKTHKIEYR